MILKDWRRMCCCIRSSNYKGRTPGNLMGRFWKGEDCSRMSSRATVEGINPFRKESHGPDHPQGWEPPTPGGGSPLTFRDIIILNTSHAKGLVF